MNELEKRIAASLARNPEKTNHQIAKNFKGVGSPLVALVRARMESGSTESAASPPEAASGPGIALRGMRVLSRRPAESAAKFIKRLPKSRGFNPKDLSREWGMSEETIRRHARDLNCLKHVEVCEDEWVQLVLHPETAANYTL